MNRPMTRRQFLAGSAALAAAGCAPTVADLYDGAPLDDPAAGRCVRSGRFSGQWIYQENDHIRGVFAPTDLAAYRQAIPPRFAMPERPLIRVSVLDFSEMANGAVYRESEVSVLALHQGQPGWFLLTMPVTDGDACAGGRAYLGTPKVMRRITLERETDRYVGTSFAWGGRTPEFRLTVEVREPGDDARELLRYIRAFPDLMLLNGRVLRTGGSTTPVEDLERSGVLTLRRGEARLEHPSDASTLLNRLGVGTPLAAYWARVRFRYSITPR